MRIDLCTKHYFLSYQLSKYFQSSKFLQTFGPFHGKFILRLFDLFFNELDDTLKEINSMIGELKRHFRKTGQAVPQQNKNLIPHQTFELLSYRTYHFTFFK